MYQGGVTCLDCHTRHSYKNTLATTYACAATTATSQSAAVIDPAEHGHHKLNDKGGECIGCHMPVTVYMQRHPRHDHGFTIPDPLLTKELGIPNACNRCHADQTTDWALKYTEEWYGTKMNRPTRERARWIAAAENGRSWRKGQTDWPAGGHQPTLRIGGLWRQHFLDNGRMTRQPKRRCWHS